MKLGDPGPLEQKLSLGQHSSALCPLWNPRKLFICGQHNPSVSFGGKGDFQGRQNGTPLFLL